MKIHRLLAVLLLSSPLLAQIDTGAGGGGGGSGTVTSVAATVPSGFAIAGSPVTTTGTLAITYTSAADQILLSTASNTAGFATLPTCSAATSALSYNVTTHAFGCNTIGAPALETVGDPGANKSFTMSTRTLNFNFTGNWGAGFGYSITSNGSNASTGPLLQLSSGSGTTHDVFQACALGTSNCVKFTSAGLFTTIGTALIDATKLSGNLPALNGSALTNLPAGTPSYPVTVAGTVTSGGVPYFSATTTETSSALLTSNSPVLGGGAGAAPKTATFLTTNGTSELDIGVAGASGILGLKGTTSGTATFTAPAVAGTTTNPVAVSNVLLGPAGTAAAPTYGIPNGSGAGMFQTPGTGLGFSFNGVASMAVFTNRMILNNAVGVAWGATVDDGPTTGVSPVSAGIVGCGNGTTADVSGTCKGTRFQAVAVAFGSITACAAGTEGSTQAVTDSNTATWGAAVANGGANHILAYCNGTAWTVAAK